MESKNNPDDRVKDYLNFTLTYYDTTIAILLLILLLLDSLMINHTPDYFYQLYIVLLCIIIIDLCFKVQILSSILKINSIFNSLSKSLMENFLKSIAYMIILVQIIITPPEVPLTFLLPQFASIDFYFMFTVVLFTGLYFALFNVLKQIFVKEKYFKEEF